MAERMLIEPVKLYFDGRDADEHRMDALLLGQSLSGIARIYNSVGHFYFHGQFRTSEHTDIRVQVGPPKPGSIFYLIYMLLIHGKLAVYPELLFELAELAVPEFIKAMIAKKTGQPEMLGKALDVIDRQNERYHEMVRVGQDNGMRTQEQLVEVIQHLVSQNRGPMSDMAAPVGKTVNEIRQIPPKSDPILIDAPTAESLRSPEEVTVGDLQQFRGVVVALDTRTGTLKFEEQKTGREYRGRITDPSLMVPQNVYSHALDTKLPITITAKPTIKEDGEIHKLFVSDARND
ncbi:hypothetical protein [Mesorhizobium caraganae]|uniref:DUF7946 domain-containing protein n=1 Tax=Mesorhizobium caraganae TaxID=483206 RepID=UPI0033388ABB